MKPFNVLLSEQQRQTLEAARRRHGLRSEADVVRKWIDGGCRTFADAEDATISLQHSFEQLAESGVLEMPKGKPSVNKMKRASAERRGSGKAFEGLFEVQIGPTKPPPGAMLKKR